MKKSIKKNLEVLVPFNFTYKLVKHNKWENEHDKFLSKVNYWYSMALGVFAAFYLGSYMGGVAETGTFNWAEQNRIKEERRIELQERARRMEYNRLKKEFGKFAGNDKKMDFNEYLLSKGFGSEDSLINYGKMK